MVALWVATVLSVVKPWGRTRWGVRALASREPVAHAAPAPGTAAPMSPVTAASNPSG